MGIFSTPKQRQPYVPPMGGTDADNDNSSSGAGTMLGGPPPASNDWLSRLAPMGVAGLPADKGSDSAPVGKPDPNLVRVADPVAEAEIAQQRPQQPSQPRALAPVLTAPTPAQRQLMSQPGRGYGMVPQETNEHDMSPEQKGIHRSQAFTELARRPLSSSIAAPLPDDWERTKPSEIVDDIKRAAQRHAVPTQMLARLLYQEGKFNEPENLPGGRPLVMESVNPKDPIGWAQMTTETLNDLRRWARERGDLPRARELEGYSLANREQAFDAAAELLAYQHRMLGSWPAAVGAYNIGRNYLHPWLNGKPSFNGNLIVDPYKIPGRWRDMSNYLTAVLRGAPEGFSTTDMYEPGVADDRSFRVAAPVKRSATAVEPWRISQDAKENP